MNHKLSSILLSAILFSSVIPAYAYPDFYDSDLGPQHYIDRYNNENKYRKWFDTYYSNYTSIYQAVDVEEPWYLEEIRSQKLIIMEQIQVLQDILQQIKVQAKLIHALNATLFAITNEPKSQSAVSAMHPWNDPTIVQEKKKYMKNF